MNDQPKWEAFSDQSAKTSLKQLKINGVGAYLKQHLASSTPSATPTSIDTPTEKFGGLIRPIGRKAANRKTKEKVED